jgi:transposase-like protein
MLCRTFGTIGLSYRQLQEEFRKRKKPSGSSWRVDETYTKVRGQWKYFTRAIDKDEATIEFLLTAKRDVQATKTIAGIEK